MKRKNEVLIVCENGIEAYPKDASFLFYIMGLSLHELYRKDEALQAFTEAVRVNPQLVEAWHNKGAEGLGRKNEALMAYEKVGSF